jgi:hypothetical protein
MLVPFSMSDEPDLGDEFSGYSRDDQYDSMVHYTPTTYTQSEMDEALLKMRIAHQKTIDMYRDEIVGLQLEINRLTGE